jgi:hypothetical protein
MRKKLFQNLFWAGFIFCSAAPVWAQGLANTADSWLEISSSTRYSGAGGLKETSNSNVNFDVIFPMLQR